MYLQLDKVSNLLNQTYIYMNIEMINIAYFVEILNVLFALKC